jgi:hypothetical protein
MSLCVLHVPRVSSASMWSSHFIPLRSLYSPQHIIFIHHQSVVFHFHCIFFILLTKNVSRLIKPPVCLCDPPPPWHLNRVIEFHEIWYGCNAIQGDVFKIIFNPIASIILKLLRLKVVRWALLNCGFRLFMFHDNHGNQAVYCSRFG